MVVIQQNLLAVAEIVGLEAADYLWAFSQAVTHGVHGGAIFDVLILRAAMLARGEVLITLNGRHFERLGAAAGIRIESPAGAPPA
jgi:predicted nucleic acid-binding protein